MVRRSLLEAVESTILDTEPALRDRLQQITITLAQQEVKLWQLSTLETFSPAQLRQLFELRIALTRLAVETVWLELEAKGGNAYLKPSGTARRLREVAFLPVLTPSLVQLETELKRYALVEEVV